MCGRTACTLSPNGLCEAASYRGRDGQRRKPAWRDAPGGKQYYPSYNIAPGAYTPVLLSSRHFKGQEFSHGTERVIQPMKWGLVPSWHKGDPQKMEYETNNCRAEGMLTKRTYKVPLEKGQRCIILADGFYEWKRSKEKKQPYFIYFPKRKKPVGDFKNDVKQEIVKIKGTEKSEYPEIKAEKHYHVISGGIQEVKEEMDMKAINIKTEIKEETSDNPSNHENVKYESDSLGNVEPKCEPLENSKTFQYDSSDVDENKDQLLTIAGVFEVWKPPTGGEEIYSYSIITVDASPAMSFIHHRMPAVLKSDEEIEEWLDFGNIPLSKACKLIRPTECVTMHPVSSVVNNSRNNSPECVVEVDLKKSSKPAGCSFMMNWLGKKASNETESPKKRQKLE